MGLPEGWVISARLAHPALVSEEDFIAVQGTRAPRGNPDQGRQYRLAGLLRCGICGRRLESCWANSRAAYRCRHGYSSSSKPGPARPKNLYIREDRILPHLPALFILLAGTETTAGRGTGASPPLSEAEAIGYLRSRQMTLTYDPQSGTLQANTAEAVTTIIGLAS